jgi:antitoxin MazE
MRLRIKKWGNSASVRLPASLMAAAALRIDQAVEVFERDGRIIIEPVKVPVYDLNDLLSHMTPETFHDAANFGSPVGKEIW